MNSKRKAIRILNLVRYSRFVPQYNASEVRTYSHISGRKLTERGAQRILKREGIDGTVVRVESAMYVR